LYTSTVAKPGAESFSGYSDSLVKFMIRSEYNGLLAFNHSNDRRMQFHLTRRGDLHKILRVTRFSSVATKTAAISSWRTFKGGGNTFNK